MPFYELVFETGRVSVINTDSAEEALEGARVHDERARTGQQGGPQGGPAERIVKLYEYDRHPDDYNVEQTASAEVISKEVEALVDKMKDSNGVVNIAVLATEVQNLSHPMQAKEEPFDSAFKMEHKRELALDGSDYSKGKK